jgi:hypothetical protein
MFVSFIMGIIIMRNQERYIARVRSSATMIGTSVIGSSSCKWCIGLSPLQLGGSNVLLNLLEASWPLLPVVHDNDSLGLLGQELGHLVHLLLSFFDSVDTDVGDAWDTSTHGGGGTALAVLNSDDLGRLDTELLAGV